MVISFVELAVILIFGVPVIGGIIIAILTIFRGWAVKNRELRLQESRFQVDANFRQNEMNDQILHSDDYAASIVEIKALAEEVRQLRKELAEMRRRQDYNQ
ncbi:MAG: hypothetical protein ACYC1M_10960 [Armatimonadota bacterium]